VGNKVEGCNPHEGGGPRSFCPELRDYSHKAGIEVATEDETVEESRRKIESGRPGDGLVWVTPVERSIRLSE
jgi:nitrogen regulatory protein P-II 1